MDQSSYSRNLRRATVWAAGVAIAGGLAGSVLLRFAGPGEYFWLTFPLLVALCVVAGWAAGPWWRRLDDMQRQGHLVSWYWGGIGGMLMTLMALVAATGVRSPLATGGFLVTIGQSAGFLVYWLFWARGRRGPAA
jgi:hypothetical protein